MGLQHWEGERDSRSNHLTGQRVWDVHMRGVGVRTGDEGRCVREVR